MKVSSLVRDRALPSMVVFGPAVLFMLITGVVGLTTSVSPYFLISDPSSITDTPFYLGVITRIGVLMWWSTATICLFAYFAAARIRPDFKGHRFLLWAGLLTVLLALDDMLTVHEKIAPVYLGMQETTVYAVYAAWAAVMFFHFRRSLIESDYFFLVLAIFFFVCSQFIDMARNEGLGFYGVGFIEEGFKMLGISAWLGYFACFSAWRLKAAAAPSESERETVASDSEQLHRAPLGTARMRQ